MTPPEDYRIDHDAVRAGLARSTPGEIALLAQECLQRGELEFALAICQAHAHLPEGRALRLCEAVALFRLERRDEAFELLVALANQSPNNPVVMHYLAQIAARSGNLTQAAASLQGVVQAFPDFPGAHWHLANLHFPGLGYRDVLSLLHRELKPATYLEIGVDSGATLALARHSTRAMGVDPVNRLQVELPPSTRVFFEESDQFFLRPRESVLDDRRIDLTFVDGMHLFEYALRDFLHAEAWSSASSVIVLHDCLPLTPASASRQRVTKFWVGDTWKTLAVLREYRPDLRIEAVLAQPSGLVVVSHLDPESRVLSEALPDIVRTYQTRQYEQAIGSWPSGLSVVPSSEPEVTALALRALGKHP